jgi:hypothetical protein
VLRRQRATKLWNLYSCVKHINRNFWRREE